MRRARESINLGELGIGEIRSNKAATGALLLEIPGPESHTRADALASRMSALFADTGDVRIARPSKRADIRIRDLDDAAIVEEVVSAVAVAGGCGPGEVRAVAVRPGANRMGTLWLQCPLAAARKVLDGGRLKVEWSSVRVETLTKRPLQCYKCLEWKHVRTTCRSSADRSGLCYLCGSAGYRAAACDALATCPVCRDSGGRGFQSPGFSQGPCPIGAEASLGEDRGEERERCSCRGSPQSMDSSAERRNKKKKENLEESGKP
ncbi:uncharacterized protein LOC116853606 [Odontomachus brunneus]|uniref:uncharacterized protein LOC116853606 n=1 Tax=Odontomachus brunneus TaxID=486640 RepID=UPI0013F1BA53|nr:uncharacterized protein LOC116853606 [Odontomachus brunneus]